MLYFHPSQWFSLALNISRESKIGRGEAVCRVKDSRALPGCTDQKRENEGDHKPAPNSPPTYAKVCHDFTCTTIRAVTDAVRPSSFELLEGLFGPDPVQAFGLLIPAICLGMTFGGTARGTSFALTAAAITFTALSERLFPSFLTVT